MSTYYLKHHPHTWLYFPPLTLSVGILTFRSIYQYTSEGKASCSEVLAVTKGEGFITQLVLGSVRYSLSYLPVCGTVVVCSVPSCRPVGVWDIGGELPWL